MSLTPEHYSSHDAQIWEEELEGFVPDRVFDTHIHMFRRAHLRSESASFNWSDADLGTLRGWAERLYPGRTTNFLVLGTPAPEIDVAAHNAWGIEQIHSDRGSRFNRLVTPACKLGDIERDVGQPGVLGLKPYRLFSATGEVHQCRIHDFLPHEQLELADQLGLWVTMHLSRHHGCADADNLDDLAEYTTRRYPHVKWILAHCARSFTYWPIRHGVDRLREMPNIWYDLSAVTDVRPFVTLFQKEDLRRIFYGSDGVDSTYFHGQYAALGRAWQGLDAERAGLRFPHCEARPILCIYEQLLSMKHAAEIAGLTSGDIERIFWRNAAEAFQLDEHETAHV